MTIPLVEELPALLESHSPKRAARATRSLRVLIVEDNQDAADSLRMLLELGGCEVEVAYNGLDGVRLAHETEPDLVLCDIGLPGLNGYEVARRLRADGKGKQPFLVALTGYGEEEARRQSREAGFDRHFVKPVDPAAIEALLVTNA